MSELTSVLSGDRPPTRKQVFRGTHRSMPPEETLSRIRPVLPRAGITRLADITGLDRLGIPVTLAVRPNGRVLSVSSGKGLTRTAALVSGAMEALELHHAEVEWSPPVVRRSYDEIRRECAVPDPDELPLARAAPFPPDWPYSWTFGWDLIRREPVAVPVSMVHMGNRDTRVFDLFSFQISSNGLASGNDLVEAIHAGLLEVIERDATTCHAERWRSGTPPPLVDTDDIAYPTVRDLLDRLARQRVLAAIFDCTVDTDVPVYLAHLVDLDGQVPGTFTGYGAHLDPEIALTRAITEAVQARTVTIAGSRDDLYRHREVRRLAHAASGRPWEATLATAPRAAAPGPSRATDTFDDDITVMIESLRRAGLHRVVVLDLSTSWCPISVVKVIVPGLEGYRMENYAPGPRARSFAARGREVAA